MAAVHNILGPTPLRRAASDGAAARTVRSLSALPRIDDEGAFLVEAHRVCE